MKKIPLIISFAVVSMAVSCGSRSNNRATSIEDLDKVQAEEEAAMPHTTSSKLNATELIELADCADINCVQLYMKDRSSNFFYGKKGEYAALHRSAVTDTAGQQLIMPLSTLYIDVNTQASWRMAHTVHTKELSDALMNEFITFGFVLADSGYYNGMRYKQRHYTSDQYPGKHLYTGTTFSPWYAKGLYMKPTWQCYVFEVRGE